MKYTKELLLKACAEFVPTLVEHQQSAHVNMPELLKHAAVEAFVQQYTEEYNESSNKCFASFMIRKGLLELKEYGCLYYGRVENYWG